MTDPASPPSVGAAYFTVLKRSGPLIGATLILSIVYFWLDPHRGPAFLFPFLVFAGLGLFWVGRAHRDDHRAFERIGQPPVDGQWTAVAGTAVSLDDTADILAVRFKVYDRETYRGSRASSRLHCRYDGYYLAPTGIDTGTQVVPIKGFPDLENMPKRPMPNDMLVAAKDSARLCPPYLAPTVARAYVQGGLADHTETCLKYGDQPAAGSGEIKSWILKAGDPVCAVGRWHSGALHRVANRLHGLPVYHGTPDEVRREMRELGTGLTWFAGILLAAAAALALWSLI